MEEQKLAGVGELLDKSWKAFTKNWWKLTLVASVPGLVGMVVAMGVLILMFIIGAFSISYNIPETFWAVLLVSVAVFLPAAVWFFGWSQAAMIKAVGKATRGETIGVREVYGQARPLAWRMVGVVILSGLAAAGGWMLLVIPGIIVSVWTAVSMFVVVDEGVGGMTALVKSKYYVKGRAMAVFGRLLVMGLVAGGVSLASQVLMIIPIVGWLVATVVSMTITIIQAIFGYALYDDLKKTVKGELVSAAGRGMFAALAILGLLLPIVVIGAAVAFLAINPTKQLEKAREKQEEMIKIPDYNVIQGFGDDI